MTPTQHRYNVLASNLLYAGYFGSTLMNFFTHEGFFARNLPPRTLWVLLASLPLVLGLYYLIRRGNAWAKWLFVILYLTSVVATIWTETHRFPIARFRGNVNLVNEVGQYLLHGTAVVLIIMSFFKKPPAQPVPAPVEQPQ